MPTKKIHLPEADCDIVLVFPNGEELELQHRPSNADVDYNGSFDIILPHNTPVFTYLGDNLEPSKCAYVGQEHMRRCKQIVFAIP